MDIVPDDKQAQSDWDMIQEELEKRLNNGVDPFVGKPFEEFLGHIGTTIHKVVEGVHYVSNGLIII